MTTISAGAAAGLLVALMVISTSDSHGAAPLPAADQAKGFAPPKSSATVRPSRPGADS